MKQYEVKFISVKEFREKGFLQELNRRFLHPLGLALEVYIDNFGDESFGRVWDFRDDPEGIHFGDGPLSAEKADYVLELMESKREVREKLFGSVVQPIVKK